MGIVLSSKWLLGVGQGLLICVPWLGHGGSSAGLGPVFPGDLPSSRKLSACPALWKAVKGLPYEASSLHSSGLPQGVSQAQSLGGEPGLRQGPHPFLLPASGQPA